MNWYNLLINNFNKYKGLSKVSANKLETLEDRNELNKRIREFKEIIIKINGLEKQIGYKSAEEVRKELEDISKDKKISSFPLIKEILEKAVKKARDSYKDFKNICKDVIDKFYIEVKKMEKERDDFSENVYPNKMKARNKNGK